MSLADLPKDTMMTLRDTFSTNDGDHDGCITHAELETILEEMGMEDDRDEVFSILEKKQGKNAKIEFDDFCDSMVPALIRFYGDSSSESDSDDEYNSNQRRIVGDCEKLRKAFRKFDEDGNGYIEADELKHKLTELSGIEITDEEVNALIKEVDTDGDMKVNYEEFITLIDNLGDDAPTKKKKKPVKKEAERPPPSSTRRKSVLEMQQMFKEWDIDGNGLIDPEELQEKLAEMTGTRVSDKDIKAIIRGVDVNGDGKIDYEEFLKLMGY